MEIEITDSCSVFIPEPKRSKMYHGWCEMCETPDHDDIELGICGECRKELNENV